MSYEAEKLAIEAFLGANWPEATPLVYENVSMNDTTVLEWIRVSIQNGDAFQASMGDNPAFRYIGVLFFQIFLKPDTGSGRASQLADVITTLFRAKTISGLTFRVPQVNKVNSKSEWYQTNVSIDFFRGEQ